MEKVNINFENIIGKIKPMHAVNNGPLRASAVEQTRDNFNEFKAARIPYSRNHDTYGFMPGQRKLGMPTDQKELSCATRLQAF